MCEQAVDWSTVAAVASAVAALVSLAVILANGWFLRRVKERGAREGILNSLGEHVGVRGGESLTREMLREIWLNFEPVTVEAARAFRREGEEHQLETLIKLMSKDAGVSWWDYFFVPISTEVKRLLEEEALRQGETVDAILEQAIIAGLEKES